MMRTAAHPIDDLESIRAELHRARGAGSSLATMNFIIYVDDPTHRRWVFERATMLAQKHRARTIVLDANTDRHGAEVQVPSDDADSTATVQSERVDFGVDGIRAAQRLHLVQSLAVPELPIVLWWTSDRLFGSNTFSALLDVSDSVILDSSGSARDLTAIREYATFFDRRHHVALHDLAWMRLAPWRDVIAQFFDDPSLREELFSLRRLEITSGSEAEALYLGGWLGSRLGWNARAADEFTDRSNVSIPFERQRHGEIRRVQAVTLSSESSTYTARFDGDEAVSLEVTGKHAKERRHVPLQAVDNASLIERAILEPATDEIFETSLRMVAELLTER